MVETMKLNIYHMVISKYREIKLVPFLYLAHETIPYHNESRKIIKIENEALKPITTYSIKWNMIKRQNGKSLISLVP